MGLLSNIFNTVNNSAVGKGLDILSDLYIKPVDTIKAVFTGKISDVTAAVKSQSLSKNITSTVINTAIAGTAIYGAGALASGDLTVGTIAKSIIPSSTKGKIIAGAAAVIGTSALIQKPSLAITAPAAGVNFLENVGGLVANPSISGAIDLAKQNPILTSASLLAIGGGIAGTAATLLNTSAVKKNTEATMTGGSSSQLPISSSNNNQYAEQIPYSPETMTVTPHTGTSGGSRAKYKRRKQTPSNINNIRIVIDDDVIDNKRYLNRKRLYN